MSDLEEVCDGGDVTGTGTFPGVWHVFADLRGKEVAVKKQENKRAGGGRGGPTCARLPQIGLIGRFCAAVVMFSS